MSRTNIGPGSSGRGTVSKYRPGGSSPVRTISQGISYPLSMAVAGYLYVGNEGTSSFPYGSVTVYNTYNGNLVRTITNGVFNPDFLTFGP